MGSSALDLTSIVADAIGYKKEKKGAESERQQILAEIADNETKKNNLVKKALAAQRAKYGAGGMSGKGMTEESVLKRMREETEEPFNEKKKKYNEALNSINAPNKRNLLKKYSSIFENGIF